MAPIREQADHGALNDDVIVDDDDETAPEGGRWRGGRGHRLRAFGQAVRPRQRQAEAGAATGRRPDSERATKRFGQPADDGEPLLNDPMFKRKVAELEIDLTALEYTELRTLAGEAQGKGPGVESSLLKIKGTEIGQRLTELVLEAAGHYGAPYFRGFPVEGGNALPIGPEFATRAPTTYFNMRKTSIFGGSNEIQRNIIAKMVLGL